MNEKFERNTYSFMQGGEMGYIMQQMNWEATEMGSPETWPQSLKTTLSILLNSKFPMFLFWGPNSLCFYNDAYRPSLGIEGKHPNILGMTAKDAWPEIWDTIGPLILEVLSGGEAIWRENNLIPIFRNQKIEDVYWTFSYSPVKDETDTIGGVFVTCMENTKAIQNLKRLEESEDELKFAIEAANLSTWDYYPIEGKFKGNSRFEEWIGQPLNGESNVNYVLESVVPEDRQRVNMAIEKALGDFEVDGKFDITYKIRNKKTLKIRIVRAMGRAWFNDEKIAYRFNGTLQDVTEEQKSERELLKFNTLIERSHQFISLANADGGIDFLNPAGRKAIGWNSVQDKTLKDFIFPKDFNLADKIIQQTIARGFHSEEIRFLDVIGKKAIWHQWNLVAFKNPANNKLIGFGSVSINIEAQKDREMALNTALLKLQESEGHFKNLVRDAPIGIALVEVGTWAVKIVNDMALDIWQKSRPDIQNKSLFEILKEIKAGISPIFDRVIKTKTSEQGIEYPFLLERNGKVQTLYFNFIFQPRVVNEKVAEIMLVAMEVTETVKARHKLEESEKQFRNFVMQSPIAMTILRNKDHTIEIANNRMLNGIWRRKANDVLGRSLIEAFPELSGQKYIQMLDDVLHLGKRISIKDSLAIIDGDDGRKEIYIDLHYLPLREIDNTVSGVMVTADDVTERVLSRKKLEEVSKDLENQVVERTRHLNETNEKLELTIEALKKSNDELESFAYISSHDLQEPLRKIEMFGDRMLYREKHNLTEQGIQEFEKILTSARRMRTLITDLLAFSRTTKQDDAFIKYDLNKILNEVIDNLSEKLVNTGAKIVHDNLCEVMVVPFQIRQVFQNLLENSIKFAKNDELPIIKIATKTVKGSLVKEVSLDSLRNYCELSFKDNGIGFDPEYTEQIFEVFQRLHGKFEYQGTGIGLAIVKKIIENHRGAITAFSMPGQGATFKLYLPID